MNSAHRQYAAVEIVDDVVRQLERPGEDVMDKRILAQRDVEQRLESFERQLRATITADIKRLWGGLA